MMLTRLACEQVSPFDPLVPTTPTITTMGEARVDNLKSFEGVAAVIVNLHAA
ncbi:MAG: hypothetical protein M0037_11340 [Betaproteobacteria bacterium]|nr:hypothetical protein [Betaproteobacteria bacterium]